ncbi:cellobiose phosphotransferase system ydjc-like protein [hydrocarbon metagenome]|uniref:Cellobiose phosphotransferase system ydjc-like protein n=1 Tax=hydrocarbon metagenome TaxID=938273 RepID=A0A0W8FLV7_9ZZZZ
MKYLIVSADDFGLTNALNEGIVKAYINGIVTCVNIMPSGEAFENAFALLKENGITETGAHLSLTQTHSLAGYKKVSTLITHSGNFHNDYKTFILKFISKKIDLSQAYFELKRQMEMLNATGLKITNLSSHENIHMIPSFLNLFIRLAKEFKVKAIRFPHGDKSFHYGINMIYKKLVLSFFERRMRKILNASEVMSPDHFRGFFDSGKMNENILLQIIKSLEKGTTELICHPGILDHGLTKNCRFYNNCESELNALTSPRVKKLVEDKNIQLVSYGDFLQKREK